MYIVATPIGNLQDVSKRMLSTLNNCDVIAAEDTRVAQRLLSALNIKHKKIISVRQHNEEKLAQQIANKYQGSNVVYISDAGTPNIADPRCANS